MEKFRPNDLRYAYYYKKLGLNQDDYKLNNLSFDSFLDLLFRDKNIIKDIHWAPQTHLLPSFSLDFLMRFENFNKDFNLVLQRCFPNEEVKILNHIGHKNTYDVKDYYLTNKNKDKIYKLYRDDFEYFCYNKRI